MIRSTLSRITVSAACIAVAVATVAACSLSEPDGDIGAGGKDHNGGATGTNDSNIIPGKGENGTGSDKNPETATGLPCDVDQVLKTRCQTCHAAEPVYGASAPLVTYADLQKAGPGGNSSKKVFELVKDRIHNEARQMPPSPAPKLADAEMKALDSWISGGAKSSDATCKNDVPKDGVKPLGCTPDTTLKATKPFTMQAGGALDQYVCFGVDVNTAKKRHVTGLAPKVDNHTIVHHILLFQTKTGENTEPFACEAFGSAAWKLVAGWAPGGDNLELPKEAGFPEEAGTTHWVVQVHYNNAKNLAGATDNSGYDLCTTDQLRANDAGVLAFGSTKFSIPPRSTTTIKCDYKLDDKFKNVKMFNASPHMHTRGAAMSTERLAGGNGAPEPIFEQKNFSFEAQANFPITKTANTGDVMRTRCTWKNPGDTTISFGEGTGDEMCFDFIGYYPNIPDKTLFNLPIFTWVTPSQSASCTTE